ncbi:Protein N-acetyltransferase, RimJ/RimL family [Agromyces sp. CF514]|uniref:GNAT family N-acetyltransferase n=1 Tax=Agromyces sp. CF514 TaxID=1881031 RepID=UPI0008F09A0E|nr:GNAT family N-acetyltransferase [Agromyces sp. CF514]SFR67709.1 Protein N-acetyltransferase, RimJ/RimL family [Agromyces sp. CF514]
MTVVTEFEITIRPTDASGDAATVQRWLAHPKSAFWGMQELGVDEVADYLGEVATHPHQDSWVGSVDGSQAFLAETYDPASVLLVGIHDALPGDLGMHVLIAPAEGHARHGLTDAVFAAVMRWCFDELGAERVVVEPDVRNAAIAVKNARAGFRVLGEVDVPEGAHVKRANLSVCMRADFAASALGSLPDHDRLG